MIGWYVLLLNFTLFITLWVSGILLLRLLLFIYRKQYEMEWKDIRKITALTFGTYALLDIPTGWMDDFTGIFLTRVIALSFSFATGRRLFLQAGMEKKHARNITLLWFSLMVWMIIISQVRIWLSVA